MTRFGGLTLRFATPLHAHHVLELKAKGYRRQTTTMGSNGIAATTETDIDIVGGWSGSLTTGSGGINPKPGRDIGQHQNRSDDSCGKCGAGGFPSEMHLRTHEQNCGSSTEDDAESLSGKEKENPSSSSTTGATSISRGRLTNASASNDSVARTARKSSNKNRERSKSRPRKDDDTTNGGSSSKSSSRRHRSRSPLRSMIQRARSRSPTRRGVSFARDRTPKRTGRGAGSLLSPNAATPCTSNRGAAHIASGYLTASSLHEDALEGRPSAIDLIPELGMSGAMASLAGRCVEVDSICPRAGIDAAVEEYRRNVLGITDRAFREMQLDDFKNIPL